MKLRNSFLPILVICVNLSGHGHAATNQYWNVGGTGGDGIWGTGPGDKNWNLTAAAPAGNTTWPDTINDVAVFQDAVGGTVTVFDPVQTAGISQTGANYTLNAGVITLVVDSAAANPFIHVQAGTLTIDSVLDGANGLIKTGGGNLLLSNVSTYVGTTDIADGTLTLSGSLASTLVTIAAPATLIDANGGFNAAAAVTNAGVLTITAAETIANLTNNAGTVAGAGPLTVTGATVFNGGTLASPLTIHGNGGGTFTNATIAGTFNGTTLLDGTTVAGSVNGNTTSTGNVLVSGFLGGGSLDVTGGILNLTGASTNTPITIAAPATLIDVNGGLDAAAAVTNSGVLTVNAADTIASLTNNAGTVDGAGPLTVTGATVFNGGTLAAPLTIHGNGGGTFTNATIAGTFNGTTSLDGATVSGTVNGNTTSAGNVLVSGSLGGGSLDVTGGTMDLTGASTNTPITIAAAATLIDANGGLDAAAAVTNSGVLTIAAADTIASLSNNAGTVAGAGPLTVTGATVFNGGTLAAPLTIYGSGNGSFTNATIAGTFNGTTSLDGATVTGTVNGNTTSTGNVLVSGLLGGGSLDVTGGTLNLTGASANTPITIAVPATLIDANGGLDAATAVTNSGVLTVNAADTIATYISNGGTLSAGGGVLTSTTANLNNGSTVAGLLAASTLTSNGAVAVSGGVTANSINIVSGILTNTGALAATNNLNIAAGATLVAGGTQSYALLTTSGSGTGTWQGNLTNPTTLAPGGLGGIGALRVIGNLTNAATGTLKFDLATASHDLVNVTGTATFGGALEFNQTGASAISPFVPIQVVSAGAYAGNISSLAENLDGAVWFNPGNGSVMLISPPGGNTGTLFGATANQTSTWISLYDDVIDPGVTNITRNSDGTYQISSGIANGGNPDLLSALAASFTPAGLNGPMLNRLSPEVYRGFQDYAVQANRLHQRSALEAPSLGFLRAPGSDSKGGCKHALAAPPAPGASEFFAAIDSFDVETDGSLNQADYQSSGMGFIGGVRTTVNDRLRLGGYLGADDGEVDGALIDADGDSWTLGLFARALVEDQSHTLVTAGLSYGCSKFDGKRGSIIADGNGWSPADASFFDVESDALELFIGASSIAYHSESFRLIPAAGLRYVCGKMDSFNELVSATTGGPIALAVDDNHYDSALAEISLQAELDLTSSLTLHGLLGINADLGGESDEVLTARFASGSRPMRATAQGLNDDAIVLGLGATYRITESIGLGIHWRGEFRSDADMQNNLGLAGTFRF